MARLAGQPRDYTAYQHIYGEDLGTAALARLEDADLSHRVGEEKDRAHQLAAAQVLATLALAAGDRVIVLPKPAATPDA